jgi:LysR family hydrogen peroxide-inducible transcriptional activator
MELHQLRYFVAVAETGGFSRGATACGIAQPSLSQQVRRLESSLGVQLFERLPRRTVMTDAGRELLPRARRILAEAQEARRCLGADGAPTRLALGVIPTIAPYVLPAVLRDLAGDHAECDLVVREDFTERLLESLRRAEIDAAILGTEPDDPALLSRVVGRDPFLLAVPRGHRLAGASSVGVSELADEAFIVLQEVHCLGVQVGELCRSRRVRPHIVSAIAQLSTALALVRAGVGATIVPAIWAAGNAPGGGVRTVPVRGASRPIVVATRRDRARSAVLATLEGTLAATLHPPAGPARRRAPGG